MEQVVKTSNLSIAPNIAIIAFSLLFTLACSDQNQQALPINEKAIQEPFEENPRIDESDPTTAQSEQSDSIDSNSIEKNAVKIRLVSEINSVGPQKISLNWNYTGTTDETISFVQLTTINEDQQIFEIMRGNTGAIMDSSGLTAAIPNLVDPFYEDTSSVIYRFFGGDTWEYAPELGFSRVFFADDPDEDLARQTLEISKNGECGSTEWTILSAKTDKFTVRNDTCLLFSFLNPEGNFESGIIKKQDLPSLVDLRETIGSYFDPSRKTVFLWDTSGVWKIKDLAEVALFIRFEHKGLKDGVPIRSLQIPVIESILDSSVDESTLGVSLLNDGSIYQVGSSEATQIDFPEEHKEVMQSACLPCHDASRVVGFRNATNASEWLRPDLISGIASHLDSNTMPPVGTSQEAAITSDARASIIQWLVNNGATVSGYTPVIIDGSMSNDDVVPESKATEFESSIKAMVVKNCSRCHSNFTLAQEFWSNRASIKERLEALDESVMPKPGSLEAIDFTPEEKQSMLDWGESL